MTWRTARQMAAGQLVLLAAAGAALADGPASPGPRGKLTGRIVFASDRAGHLDLWVMRADGTGLRQLTDDEPADADPRFSPDGKHILYTTVRQGFPEVWLMQADGGGARKVCEGCQGSWAPDGKRIAFIRDGQAYVRELAGGRERRVTPEAWMRCTYPAFAPDGKRIAVSSRHTGTIGVYVIGPDGAARPVAAKGGACTPRWSPDGRRLLYQTSSNVYQVKADGTGREQMTFGADVQHYADYAPDGEHFVFCRAANADGPWQIHAARLDGEGKPIRLTNQGSNVHPHWWAPPPATAPTDRPPAKVLPAREPVDGLVVHSGGDAALGAAGPVVENERLVLAFGNGPGPVVYFKDPAGRPVRRLGIVPVDAKGRPAQGALAARVIESTPKRAVVECAAASGEAKATVRYALGKAAVFVDVQPVDGVAAVRLEADLRYAVIPDFVWDHRAKTFDDIVYDPRRIEPERLALPTENFLLGLLGGGDSMLMCVWRNPEQEARLHLKGVGERRRGAAVEVSVAGEEETLWVAVMDAEGIWTDFALDAQGRPKPDGAGDGPAADGRAKTLAWTPPFAATWRGVLIGERRWVSRNFGSKPKDVLWLDGPAARVQVSAKQRKGGFAPRGGVVFPIQRKGQTPRLAFTFTDVVRATLGMGPCEYVIKLEKLAQHPPSTVYAGCGVCGSTQAVDRLFREGAQARAAGHIRHRMDGVHACILRVNKRLKEFLAMRDAIRKRLKDLAEAGAAVRPLAERLRPILAEYQAGWDKNQPAFKTPDYARELAERVKSRTAAANPADLAPVLEINEELRHVAGMQDSLVSKFRQTTLQLMQAAATLPTGDAKVAELIREIRKRGQAILYGRPFPG